MKKELYFALYAIKKNIESSAELRTSFLMNVIGMAINNTAFMVLWVFFVKSVGVIGGWTAADIIGLLGFSTISYGLVFSVASGIRRIAEYAPSGVFDHFMLSPKNLLLRVATSHFGASVIGDFIFGLVCLIIYAILIQASLYQIILILLMILSTSLVFLAVTIMIYSLSFFFMEADNITRGIFEFFLTPSLFHGGAFQGVMRFVFTFIVPSLLLGAIPVEAVRDVSLPKIILTITLGLIWFVLSIKFFNSAVKRYESSNFMTFGG